MKLIKKVIFKKAFLLKLFLSHKYREYVNLKIIDA